METKRELLAKAKALDGVVAYFAQFAKDRRFAAGDIVWKVRDDATELRAQAEALPAAEPVARLRGSRNGQGDELWQEHPAPHAAPPSAPSPSRTFTIGGNHPPQAAPSADVAELVKRLHCIDTGAVPWNVAIAEAADALTSMAAQLEEWQTNYLRERDKCDQQTARIASLEAENSRARELLERCSIACKIVPANVRNGEHISLPGHIAKFLEERKP